MLVPRPPSLPLPRRAVPTIAIRHRQPQAITVGHVLPARGDPPEAAAVRAEPDRAIRFTVVYRLAEYLWVLREHARARLLARAPRGRLSWGTRLAVRLLVPLVGTPVFLMKKRRMPACRFTIDERGIERRTRDGVLRVAWTDVVAVHRYSEAWLVDKGDGGLPIPFRCLDAAGQALFERLSSA